MKRVLAVIFLLFSLNHLYAQGEYDDVPRKVYFGVGTGINNATGAIGLNAEVNIIEHITVMAGGGYSSWGLKGALGMRYYLEYPRGVAFGLTFARNTGLSEPIMLNLEVEDPNGRIAMREVPIEYNPISALNATMLYFWRLGRHTRFNLEGGYSFLLNKEGRYQMLGEGRLTSASRLGLDLARPGGLIFALGFSFGIE